MSLKRRNKDVTKNGLIDLAFHVVLFLLVLCIVIKIAHAMFSKNFISIKFID